jgi:hypothetical protein
MRTENQASKSMNSENVSQVMSEWMRSLSVPERMRALAMMYSHITVATRELFFPQTTSGKERMFSNYFTVLMRCITP